MKVKRLKMQSFRGIGDLTLEFPTDEPIVFIGINGMGKSSILDCLAILLSQLIGRIAQHENMSVPANMEANLNVGHQVNIAEVYGTVQVNFGYLNQQISSADQDTKIREFGEQDLTNERNYTHNEITTFIDSQEVTWSLTKVRKKGRPERKSNLLQLESIVDQIISQLAVSPENNLPFAVYYPVNRAVLNITLEITNDNSLKQIDAYDQALTGVQISFRNFFQWFRVLEDLENEERRDNSSYQNHQLEAVRQSIYSLLKGFSNLRVRRSPLRMTVNKQDRELIVNQLSDGEKNLLALAGDLARRLAIANPSLPNPLQGSGVVMIDEIELHLHPKWQREIIPALTRTFPNCQFIVTTHSPQVLSQVKPDSIYILEKTDEGIIARHPESSYGRDSNRILEDLMDVSERPQLIKDELRQLFRLIDQGDIDGAKQLRQQLENEIGYDEPEFVRADVLMRRKEILKR